MLRRFVPLLALLALSLFVLLARLWDVQVVQHETWAREAANIVRKYGVEPYRRGSILDRHGREYRYHHLFAELLVARLQERAPAAVRELHSRTFDRLRCSLSRP